MMIVMGAAGFLGSCMISKLNQHNFNYIIAVDEFDQPETEQNLYQKKILDRIPTHQLLSWLEKNHREIEFIFNFNNIYKSTDHQPMRENVSSLDQKVWQKCTDYQIPLIFCLSQITHKTNRPSPDISFEQWALQQKEYPFFWAGVTVPEVYGPNEYYLGENASVIYRLFKQWQKEKNFGDAMVKEGLQPQDYVYVKDVVEICYFLVHHRRNPGIYPVNTGKMYSTDQIKETLDFVLANKGFPPQEIPPADLTMLRAIGYHKPVATLQEGASDYIVHYLQKKQFY